VRPMMPKSNASIGDTVVKVEAACRLFDTLTETLDATLTHLETCLQTYPKHALSDPLQEEALHTWDTQWLHFMSQYQQALLQRGEVLTQLIQHQNVAPCVMTCLKAHQTDEPLRLARQQALQAWCQTRVQFIQQTQTLHHRYDGDTEDHSTASAAWSFEA
jgi:hypothetical protein